MYGILAVLGLVGLLSSHRRVILVDLALLATTLIRPEVFTVPFKVVSYGQAPIAMFFAGVAVFGFASHLRPWLWLGGLLMVACFLLAGGPRVIAFYLAVIWVILRAGQSQVLGKIARPRSDCSYGLYIYGWPCQQIVLCAAPDINPYVLTGAAMPLACVVAYVSWTCVERPLMVLCRNLLAVPLRSRLDVLRFPTRLLALDGRRHTGLRVAAGIAVVFVACLGLAEFARSVTLQKSMPLGTAILDFGPHSAHIGEKINLQPSGDSAIWVALDSTPPEGTVIFFAGRPLTTTIGKNIVTGRVPQDLLDSAGNKALWLEYRGPDIVQDSNQAVFQVTD